MATLLPPPSATAPHTSPRQAAMASRRVPLGNLPNAANSPFREPVAPGTKRPRTNDTQTQPAAKKQVIEAEDVENRRTLVGKKVPATTTAITRKIATATKTNGTKVATQVSEQNLNEIRQWQKHYKKLFPTMTFFYDGVPEETRRKIGKQLQQLGSKEEIFFSNAVTHVVTTRNIPTDISSSSSTGQSPPKAGRDGTVNPNHLKKAGAASLHPQDVLVRAKKMNIKVWGLEKLQRMLTTMFNAETGEAPSGPYHSRTASTTQTKNGPQGHLGQMLQKEKEYAQATMDWASDMAAFRGYYVYVHDMDELTKPTIVRDYSKPATKEQGKWPQLRVTATGRCPFLDDPSARFERPTAAPTAEKAPRTRAAAARERTPVLEERKALAESNANAQRRSRSVSAQPEDKKPASMDPPRMVPVRGTSTDNLPLFGSAQASLRQHPRFAGGEPIASGVQPSNVTSAIRSQMISSTAAQPGGKAGRTKELNLLQRKVQQQNNPYLNNDLRGAINASRGTKRKANDSLQGIQEDVEESEQVQQSKPVRTQAVAPAPRKKKVVEKEMKPGYCENCRAKFQDFDEHVLSRTHRKFAMDDQNWKELDDLLGQLGRPLKHE